MSVHCLPVSMVSDGKSALNPIEGSVHLMSCFSLPSFKILSLSLVFISLTIMYLGMDFFSLSYLEFFELLGSGLVLHIKLGEFP